jgi:hypothetical protein
VRDALALMRRPAGRLERALEVLEPTVPARRRSYDIFGEHGGMAWIRAQVALADLYRSLGRISEASLIENTVLSLLRVADDDLRLLDRIRGHSEGVARRP